MLDARLKGVNGWSLLDRSLPLNDPDAVCANSQSDYTWRTNDDQASSAHLGSDRLLWMSLRQRAEVQDAAMDHIGRILSIRPVKNLLVVEDNDAQQRSIATIIGNGDVKVHGE